MSVKVRSNGLEVDGNLLPLISGAFHYWRMDPERWSHTLSKVRDLGFSVVETYVPWSVHEKAQGEFDFGRGNPALDLERFLALAAEKGLKVILRPGPHINSEMSDFGFPRRVLDDPEIQARNAAGGMVLQASMLDNVPVPSYAQEKLFLEFEPFLAALTPILKRNLHPKGPVVALQIDNENGYFFRTRTYDLDYSDASLALYRHFLEVKYHQVSALNKAYGIKVEAFDQVEPPRACAVEKDADLPRHLDWVEYKEYQIQWSLGKLADLYRSKGLDGVPFFHNFFGPSATPFNIAEVEKDSGIDFCGLDSYPGARVENTLDAARYLSVTSRLPYIPEFGAGHWLHDLPPTEEDFEASILMPFMGGVRAVNFYMLVERERWTGSPLNADGERRKGRAELYEKFTRFAKELEWHKATPMNQALLLSSRECQQLEAVLQASGEFPQGLESPGLLYQQEAPEGLLGGGAGLPGVKAFFEAGREFLRSRHFSYALGDSSIPGDKLKKHPVAVLACWGMMDEAFARRLKSYVENGGTLILGPSLPTLNTRLEPLKALADWSVKPGEVTPIGDGRVLLSQAFDEKGAQAALKKGKVTAETTLSDTSLELALHRLGGKQILFVRNPAAEDRPATVYREGKFVLKPLWSSDKFLGGVEEREVTVRARETKVWEIIPC